MSTPPEPKVFTDEEIKAFTLQQAEKYTKNLEWRNRREHRYNYGRGGNTIRDVGVQLAQYKERGFPTRFKRKSMADRREFLITRLLSSNQEKWNDDYEKALVTYEASKPNVSIKVKTEVVIELKDRRPKGHTFIFQRDRNGKLKATQKQGTKATTGRKICTAEGNYSAQDFEDMILLLAEEDIPDTKSLTKGKAKIEVTAKAVLTGNYNLEFAKVGEAIKIREENRYGGGNEPWWEFNIADLLEAIKAFKTPYKAVVEEVKEESKVPEEASFSTSS